MSYLTFYPIDNDQSTSQSFFAYDPYIEKFWLPNIGPTASVLLNQLSIQALICRQRFFSNTTQLSLKVGTGNRQGHNSPVNKQLKRLCQFGLITELKQNEFMVPRTISSINNLVLYRLTRDMQEQHAIWMDRLSISHVSTQKRRMKALVSHLEIMGVSDLEIQNALYVSGLHPSIIGEAIASFAKKDSAA